MHSYREMLKEIPPEEVERLGRVPDELLQRMGRIGLFGASIPEHFGGLGLDFREYLALAGEMVRLDLAMAMVCLAHLSIGIKAILLFGNEAQKSRYLPPAARGEMIFAFALTEPLIGSDAQHIQTEAELSPDGSHYILNGQKTYITNANYAQGLTVFAQLDSERPGFMGAFVVETGWEGVRIGKDMPKMGLKASSTAAIQLRNVRVPVENLLGSPGDGFKIAMTVLNYGRLTLAQASTAIMEQSLQDMRQRASSRKQFGVPVGDFPLIQEKLVHAKVNALASAAMIDLTAVLLERDPHANVAMETSHCKLFATTRAWDTVYDALQVAGGSGYLATQPYEKRMRDFRVTTVFEGTTEIHSMYPAMFLVRKWAVMMQESGLSPWKRLLFLLKACVPKGRVCPDFGGADLPGGCRFVRGSVWAVKRLLALGFMVYGRKLSEKQFLLRRITTVSLYAYAAISLLAGAAGKGRKDMLSSDLHRYFLLEAKEMSGRARRIFPDRRERLHRRIVSRMRRED
ncbi:MAG: acyl-CoA dehydrogenase family protein [Syntrophobacteraceae bacterium]